MICHLYERSLFMHAHGELEGAERFLLQCHLEGCDDCRARWAKSVVEKDQLRRALSPVPTLDPEGERRLQIIGARIRAEQRPVSGPMPAAPSSRAPDAGAGRSRRVGALLLASALLAIALTAMAAAWGPSLLGVNGVAAPTQVPLGACFSPTHCPNCAAHATQPAGSVAGPKPSGTGKATVLPPTGNGATDTVPVAAGSGCSLHAPGAALGGVR